MRPQAAEEIELLRSFLRVAAIAFAIGIAAAFVIVV
jgi:hypothetical protein